MFSFGLLDQSRQNKGSIDGATSLSKTELLASKHLVLLCYAGHDVGHPDSQKPQDVGGDRDGAVLAHG